MDLKDHNEWVEYMTNDRADRRYISFNPCAANSYSSTPAHVEEQKDPSSQVKTYEKNTKHQ